jgi:two-component system, NarL family, response regulator EvgA
LGAPQRFGCHPDVPGAGTLHRVFIVDENPSVRIEIRSQLESSGLAVCGEAFDGLDALERAPELNPDLIILDLSMPRMNGLEAARKLHSLCPNLPILLNTMHSAVIRSETGLPEGILAVVDKRENLLPRAFLLLPKSDAVQPGAAL